MGESYKNSWLANFWESSLPSEMCEDSKKGFSSRQTRFVIYGWTRWATPFKSQSMAAQNEFNLLLKRSQTSHQTAALSEAGASRLRIVHLTVTPLLPSAAL